MDRSPKQASGARSLAFETLRRVEEHNAYADVELGTRLARARLSVEDQGLATRIVYGTLAWQGRLDWHLARLCSRPLNDLDPWLRVILRLGIFQLLFLDRVPDYAAVNTSVDLARRFKGGAATGLVNATLRRATRELPECQLPDVGTDPIGARSVRWSHPPWLVEKWRDEFGEKTLDRILMANQEPSPTTLRVNALRATPETVREEIQREKTAAVELAKYSPVGLRIRGPLLSIESAIASGTVTLQSEASQLIAYVVSPKPDERILDACGAPGGKATHLAELMDNRGNVTVVDVNRKGLSAAEQRARDLGISILETRHADVRQLPRFESAFDRVLVDAPCSGLGTLRGHPELRWRVRPESVSRLADLQFDVLTGASKVCTVGGLVIYSTCTINRRENEEVVERFCENNPSFRIEHPASDLPATIRPLVDSHGFLRTFPHRHDLDGFFAARLRRQH